MSPVPPTSEELTPVSAAESVLRERLLDSFFALGLHPRLLHYLRGPTEDEEWASLERLVNSWPHGDLDEVFRGGWRRWLATPPPTRSRR